VSTTNEASRRLSRRGPMPAEIELSIGALAVIAGALVASTVPHAEAVTRTLVLALAVGVFAWWANDWRPIAASACLAFLVADGFLVDRYGNLQWHGCADALRVVAFFVAAATGWWASGGRWADETEPLEEESGE